MQWFICIGGSLRLALCLLIIGLVKILFFVNLSKFGCRFLCAQKRLPISKTPCITPSLWTVCREVWRCVFLRKDIHICFWVKMELKIFISVFGSKWNFKDSSSTKSKFLWNNHVTMWVQLSLSASRIKKFIKRVFNQALKIEFNRTRKIV